MRPAYFSYSLGDMREELRCDDLAMLRREPMVKGLKCGGCKRRRSERQFLANPRDPRSRRFEVCGPCRERMEARDADVV